MKILVLAGGYDQIALINELKQYGHTVLLADYFEHPPAEKFADAFFQISTLDEEAIEYLAKKEAVDMITTACTDQALLTVARVSEKLGLPCYIDAAKALCVTNKFYMKEIFKKHGIPTADYVLLEKGHNNGCEAVPQDMAFPLVVKPCDCNSSKGVLKVTDRPQLEKAIELAFSLSRSGKVVVEQYLIGEEVSIDAWIDSKGAKLLSVTQTMKLHNNPDAFTIFKSCYPVADYEKIEGQIQIIADKIAEAFGLAQCPLLIQAIVNDGRVYVVEFSARMGGGTKYKLIEWISGINIMQVYVRRVLGDTTQIVTPVLSKKKIELNYLYANPEKITSIIGLEQLKKENKLQDYFIYKPLGVEIKTHITSSDRVMGFLITADTQQELESVREQCMIGLDVLDGEKSILFRENF